MDGGDSHYFCANIMFHEISKTTPIKLILQQKKKNELLPLVVISTTVNINSNCIMSIVSEIYIETLN